MIKHFITFKYIALLFASTILLTGCLGGTVAQQIARSIATSMADKAVASAMDVQDIDDPGRFNRKPKNILFKDTSADFKAAPPDPYRIAFANARFEQVKPIAEPLPIQQNEVKAPVVVAISNQLVRVELFNLLIGEEKAAIYAKAQLMGVTSLPKPREWKLWQVATGIMKKEKAQNEPVSVKNSPVQRQQLITFLIPPEFGKLPSGSVALVELANLGELNIARYKAH